MNRAEEIRRQFDEAFRVPNQGAREQVRDRLLLNLGQRSLSLPLNQVAEVLRSRAITPLPGSPPELLGLIGLRGSLVPVYRLADLMGEITPSQTSDLLWILVVPQPELVGLALEAKAASLVASTEEAQEVDLVALVGEIQRRFSNE